MSGVIFEWLEFSVRWLHVIAGIAWIGSSFYFVHLDLSLKKREGLPEGASGEAWQVHGGGFYNMVKYMVAPTRMPEDLTWFEWEAYTTWLSGVALMVLVYYFSAGLYLLDPHVLDLPNWAGILISILGLALGWIVYDRLCKSRLAKNENLLAAVGFVFLVVLSFLFTLIFSGRGMFMQMGALIGTMMVANVAHVIIPNQKKVVNALIAGKTPDAKLGEEAKQRSVHNNYLTLPVIFVMIANHYPLAFASQFNWLILAIVLVVGAVIRHFFNTMHKGLPKPWWTWGVAAAGMLVVVWLSSFQPQIDMEAAEVEFDGPINAETISFNDVENIILSRCSMCHAREPLWEGITVPPKNIVLETGNDILRNARAIEMQTVRTHAMPPANITELEPYERLILATWLDAGKPTE